MAFWTMGVGVPIKNNSFRFGTKKETTLNGSAAAAQKVINVDNTSPTIANLLKSDDRFLIGPNSSSQSETGLIYSVSVAEITAQGNLTYSYADEDPITFTGTLLPEAWTVSGSLTPYGISYYGVGSGKDDDYCIYGLGAGSGYFEQQIAKFAGLSVLEASTKYRGGGYFADGNSVGDFSIYDDTPGSAFLTVALNGGGWAARTATGTTSATPEVCYVRIESTGVGLIGADCLFLEHAVGTDDAANGVYTFDEYPVLGSVAVETRETEIETQLLNNTLAVFDPFNSQGKEIKHTVTAEFGFCAQTFMDNLTKLQRWQRKGNLLTLHTDLDNIPPVLYGKMYITNRRKDFYDVTRSSFTFTFKEV